MKKIITLTLLIAISLCGLSFAQPEATIDRIKSIDAITKIPGRSVQMVESNGRIFFVTPNGRYVIKGDLYDMWAKGKRITSVANLKASASKINLSQIGVKLEDLFHLKYGNGPKQITVFVSPGCPYCKRTMQEMMTGDLAEKYTFNLVPVPLLGKSSQVAVKKLVASIDKAPEKTLKALMFDDYSKLTTATGGDLEGVKRSLITAQVIGIDQVPVLLTEAGTMKKGSPKNLSAWLEGVH